MAPECASAIASRVRGSKADGAGPLATTAGALAEYQIPHREPADLVYCPTKMLALLRHRDGHTESDRRDESALDARCESAARQPSIGPVVLTECPPTMPDEIANSRRPDQRRIASSTRAAGVCACFRAARIRKKVDVRRRGGDCSCERDAGRASSRRSRNRRCCERLTWWGARGVRLARIADVPSRAGEHAVSVVDTESGALPTPSVGWVSRFVFSADGARRHLVGARAT